MQDIEGRFDYNSWMESPEGLALAASLSKDTVLAEGRPRARISVQKLRKINTR